MFARGKSRGSELSSVGRFFAKGSTLERATAFTKSAATHDRNALDASRKTTVDELGASKEHPVQVCNKSLLQSCFTMLNNTKGYIQTQYNNVPL